MPGQTAQGSDRIRSNFMNLFSISVVGPSLRSYCCQKLALASSLSFLLYTHVLSCCPCLRSLAVALSTEACQDGADYHYDNWHHYPGEAKILRRRVGGWGEDSEAASVQGLPLLPWPQSSLVRLLPCGRFCRCLAARRVPLYVCWTWLTVRR
jgi:hypothetical protein